MRGLRVKDADTLASLIKTAFECGVMVLKSGNNTLYSDSGVDKNTTSKSTTISGKGSMDLTLTITDSNGGSWTRTKSVNFSTDSSVNFN